MPLRSTDIFSDDPQTERLAEFFDDLYGYLLESGVPEDRLPTPWHVLSRAVRCIDPELLREWLDAYSAVESESEPDDEDVDEDQAPPAEQPEPPRRRPSYLRALEFEAPDPDSSTEPDAPEDARDDAQEAAEGSPTEP